MFTECFSTLLFVNVCMVHVYTNCKHKVKLNTVQVGVRDKMSNQRSTTCSSRMLWQLMDARDYVGEPLHSTLNQIGSDRFVGKTLTGLWLASEQQSSHDSFSDNGYIFCTRDTTLKLLILEIHASIYTHYIIWWLSKNLRIACKA